jgi:probable rRNA maturation factor
MRSKNSRHSISFSVPPRSIATDLKGAKLHLDWDRKAMARRLGFVLDLMCEGAASVHIEFVDELQMGSLNWQFRGKDKPTDVLSFPPHRGFEIEPSEALPGSVKTTNLGELAICIPVCIAQAKTHRCSWSQEIERMMIHGLVHLKGFDHERSDAAFAVMTLLERGLRTQLNSALGEPDFCTGRASETKKKMVRAKRRSPK